MIRVNQFENDLKLVIVVINPEESRLGEHIHLLWAFNLSRRQFFERLLTASSLTELSSIHFRFEKNQKSLQNDEKEGLTAKKPFSGIFENVIRRSGHYLSDFTDGFKGDGTCSKVISTTLFLFFLTILASTAMGVLNEKNTRGKISMKNIETLSQKAIHLKFKFLMQQ